MPEIGEGVFWSRKCPFMVAEQRQSPVHAACFSFGEGLFLRSDGMLPWFFFLFKMVQVKMGKGVGWEVCMGGRCPPSSQVRGVSHVTQSQSVRQERTRHCPHPRDTSTTQVHPPTPIPHHTQMQTRCRDSRVWQGVGKRGEGRIVQERQKGKGPVTTTG